MNLKQKIRLSLTVAVVSFLAILTLVLYTSPIDKVGYSVIFFGLLLVFLISFGHLLIYLRKGDIGRKGHGRIVILSVFIMLLLMFRSAQSLNWVDALILILVVLGLLFYSSRRSA